MKSIMKKTFEEHLSIYDIGMWKEVLSTILKNIKEHL